MLKRIAQSLWGKFESREELGRFLLLALQFGFIIGVYWTLRPIKDAVFNAIVGGKDWQWSSKIFSLLVNIPLVMIYSKLIDKFQRHKLFYGLTIGYGVATLLFAWLLSNPVYGLANTVASPYRIVGWAWYAFVESFGSLVIALFWAFATDVTKPEAAKRAFPLIAFFAQIGNILGPRYLRPSKLAWITSEPVSLIVAICGVLMFGIALLMWVFVNTVPAQELTGYGAHEKESSEEPGFLEGLKLLVTEGYLLGIMCIIGVYEFIVTIIDNHFKVTAYAQLESIPGMSTAAHVSEFLADYAEYTGYVALVCLLTGINNIQRKLGMTASLIMLPILVGVAIVLIKLNPTQLYIAMGIMVFSKAVNYALNQPTLKQLYIPTSKDTKYKSQAWIEAFGSRATKAGGSAFAALRTLPGWTVPFFLTVSSSLSLALVVVWAFVAVYVAAKYNKAIEEDSIVC